MIDCQGLNSRFNPFGKLLLFVSEFVAHISLDKRLNKSFINLTYEFVSAKRCNASMNMKYGLPIDNQARMLYDVS